MLIMWIVERYIVRSIERQPQEMRGKVSNRALSVHDYVETPAHFAANTEILPLDGTPIIVTFHLVQ